MPTWAIRCAWPVDSSDAVCSTFLRVYCSVLPNCTQFAYGFSPAHKHPMHLTTSHRIEEKGQQQTEEAARVAASADGKVARARHPVTGQRDGPLRAWPGGLSMGRSLGDSDCGDWLLAEPSVYSTTLHEEGCDILIASDGLWDAVGLPEVYALVERWPNMKRSTDDLVSRAVEMRGLHDDITVLLIRAVPDDGRTDRLSYRRDSDGKTSPIARLGRRFSKEKLQKPPSWHNEYYHRDEMRDQLSVKGGQMYEKAYLTGSESPAGARPPESPNSPLARSATSKISRPESVDGELVAALNVDSESGEIE